MKVNDKSIGELKDMLADGDQPACVKEAKRQLAAKGPFVGHTIIEVESTNHLGQHIYAVKTTVLVDSRQRALGYREFLKAYGTNVDRVLEYVDFLEEVVRELGRE